tara:strand:- start:724 stop:900 length:177 start_codon:yes stop_codon:yes gene_type:complete
MNIQSKNIVTKEKMTLKPCGGLCDKYTDGICHNFCLLTQEQKIEVEKKLQNNQILTNS